MKCLPRLFLLLFVCVLLLTAFSIPTNALELNEIETGATGLETYAVSTMSVENEVNKPYYIYIQDDSSIGSDVMLTDLPYPERKTTRDYIYVYEGYSFTMFNYLAYNDKTTLLQKDKQYNVAIENIYNVFTITEEDSDTLKYQIKTVPDSVSAFVMYDDGTTEYFNVELIPKASTKTYNLKFSIKPYKDVVQIVYTNTYTWSGLFGNAYLGREYYPSNASISTFDLFIEEVDEKIGLLNTIIGWLNSLWQGIQDVAQNIMNLPSNLWGLIENGLQFLFVPNENYMLSFKDRIDTLLSNKFGAVYQVVDITLGSWDRITANDTANVITIPNASIDLPEGATFTFGNYTVQIVPTGFEWLATTIKTVVGIVCTVLFINGLRRKYDDLMGGVIYDNNNVT